MPEMHMLPNFILMRTQTITNTWHRCVDCHTCWFCLFWPRLSLQLSFTDNGIGMDLPQVHKMMSFGHCDKVTTRQKIRKVATVTSRESGELCVQLILCSTDISHFSLCYLLRRSVLAKWLADMATVSSQVCSKLVHSRTSLLYCANTLLILCLCFW